MAGQTQPVFVTAGVDGNRCQWGAVSGHPSAAGDGWGITKLCSTPCRRKHAGYWHYYPSGWDAGHCYSHQCYDLQGLMSQSGHMQQIPTVSLAGSGFGAQGQVVANVGLPGNITLVPINSLSNMDLESLGLAGAQTIATSITADGQLIMTGPITSTSDNQGESKCTEPLNANDATLMPLCQPPPLPWRCRSPRQ